MALNNTQHSTGVKPCPCHKALYNFREVRICDKNSDHDPGQDWTIKIILFSITILASSTYEKIIEIKRLLCSIPLAMMLLFCIEL